LVDCPDVVGVTNVKLVDEMFIPIFTSGSVESAGREPYDRVSTVVSWVRLPGPTVTVSDAGEVGPHGRPSAIVFCPNTACAK
jgi:hypothetical protein